MPGRLVCDKMLFMDRKYRTDVYEIETKKMKKSAQPLRLVLLADLHDQLWGERQQRLLSAIEELHADLILCAGDMLLGGSEAGTEHTLELFEGLAGMGVPMITANGNHESRMKEHPEKYGNQYPEYAARLRALGVRLLENETWTGQFSGMKLAVHGYELPMKYYEKLKHIPYDTSDLQEKFGTPDDRAFHILLAHNPVYFETYAGWGADLTLSGHLHGGIVRIPGIGGAITPQAKLFPHYDRGLFERNGKYMAVSAGLGEHTIPIRIFNPRQLIGITIKGTD